LLPMSASSADSDFNKIEFFIILALGMSFAFGLSWAGQTSLSLGLCLICMVVFGWRRYSQAARSREAESLEVFGDQVYLLGYLFTIAAILGIFFQRDSSIDELLKVGGIKLTTTVVGLSAMCLSKEMARLWRQEKATGIEDENERLSLEVREAVRILIADLMGLKAKLTELTGAFDSDTPLKFAAFAKHLGLITDALPSMHSALAQTTEQLNRLNPQVQQFDAAIVAARECGIEPMTARLEEYGATATAADTGFRSASDSAQSFNHAMQTLLNQAELAGPQMTDFAQHLRATAQAIPRLNTAVGKTTERLEALHPEVLQLNSALISAREHGVEPLSQGLHAILATAGSASSGLENVQKSAQRFDAALQELGANADADGTKVRSINQSFSRLSQAYAELDNYFQSILRAQVPPGESPLLVLQGVVQASANTVELLNQQLIVANQRMDTIARQSPTESSERLSAIVKYLADVSAKLESNNALLQQILHAHSPTIEMPPSKKWWR